MIENLNRYLFTQEAVAAGHISSPPESATDPTPPANFKEPGPAAPNHDLASATYVYMTSKEPRKRQVQNNKDLDAPPPYPL